MISNEFLLTDRLDKIRSVIYQYGEENFYISYSGGKDSTILSWLIDKAIPTNNIPRVYADTGIELNIIKNFVYNKALNDERIIIIKPSKNIKETLEKNGYPFKSKGHSAALNRFQRKGKITSVKQYLGEREDKKPWVKGCPKKLKYQFTEDFNIKISDKCCIELKEKPLEEWKKTNNKKYAIVGIRTAEGGRRFNAKCLAFRGDKLKAFQPLVPVTDDFENWIIEKYNIEICDIYKPPYNFKRTGCKGCPFNITLQKELDTLEKYFPSERKQCEIIWKPIYDEYRRINYRLRSEVK